MSIKLHKLVTLRPIRHLKTSCSLEARFPHYNPRWREKDEKRLKDCKFKAGERFCNILLIFKIFKISKSTVVSNLDKWLRPKEEHKTQRSVNPVPEYGTAISTILHKGGWNADTVTDTERAVILERAKSSSWLRKTMLSYMTPMLFTNLCQWLLLPVIILPAEFPDKL